jgi:hypothetical protein
MQKLERPLVVVGDVHLSHGAPRETGPALAGLVARHPGAEIVLNGDIFNLSLDPPERDPVESVTTLVQKEPELRQALRDHLSSGGSVSLLPGNHDAALASPDLRPALLGQLELGETAPLAVLPWFLRRGSVHVEHGHAYDPDNAPTHPLILPTPATEPLGVALTRRFLAPNQAFDFAHATEITPVEALTRAIRSFGVRTPVLLGRYFRESGRFCRHAGFRPELMEELREGNTRVERAAREIGVDGLVLRALLDDRPRPTHESFERAFFRLYFDRVLATATAGIGLGVGMAARSGTALGLGALALLYLSEAVRGRNRYEGLPVRRLRTASERIRTLTGATEVVFGHTHVRDVAGGYLNPGSFSYRSGPGRPYAWVSEAGETELREI